MANEIIRELEIDVARENIFSAILAKQYDKATRYILATITNLGVPMSIDANSTITINFERPHLDSEDSSDYQAAFSGSVVNGKVKVPLPYWALERDGDVRADISMIVGDNRLSTLEFIIRVQPAAYDGSAVTEDENYDVLTGLILQVQTLNTNMSAAEAGRITAENSRVAAETQRQQTFNTLKSAMETATDAANEVVENAASIEAIAATMQITFFYDDEGYPCYQDKSTN